jgi:hypothetical protein
MAARHRVKELLVVAALTGTSACGDGPPDKFDARAVLPTCGTADIRGGNEQVSVADQRAFDCLAGAFTAGTPAELAYTMRTTEGDSVQYWVRTLGNGLGVEQFTHSNDDFGEKGWFVVECSGLTFIPTGLPTPTGCDAPTKI